MAKTVQARLDDRSEDDLRLLRAEAGSDSDAVRLALSESAARRRRRASLREEAREAADDPADRAAVRSAMEDMDAVGVDWPVD